MDPFSEAARFRWIGLMDRLADLISFTLRSGVSFQLAMRLRVRSLGLPNVSQTETLLNVYACLAAALLMPQFDIG